MRDVLQSTARKFKIYMADSSAPTTAKTGLSSFTVYLSKDGLAESTVAPSITERGHGWYEVTPLSAHRDTLGENAWTFVASGAIDFVMKETVIAIDQQVATQPVNVTQFGGTNLTSASGIPEVKVASIATDAVNAAALAANAVTEIQSGLATQTSVDAIQTDTNDIQTRLPAALVGGKMDSTAVLDSASRAAILTEQLIESYAADGASPTVAQALMMILQHHQQKSVSGTTVTIKKLDKSTTASTYTLDSATDPTSITRAT